MKPERFGREPLVRPREYEAARLATRASHKPDDLDRAEEKLRLLRLKEPIHRANIDAAFADMAEARADLRQHLDTTRESGVGNLSRDDR